MNISYIIASSTNPFLDGQYQAFNALTRKSPSLSSRTTDSSPSPSSGSCRTYRHGIWTIAKGKKISRCNAAHWPKLGLVPNGTGGGVCRLVGFGGGGGGGFRAMLALISGDTWVPNGWPCAGVCSPVGLGVGDECFSKKLLIRPVTLYFLFSSLALRAPAEICSWCRSRKLLTVLAADWASATLTEDGSR